MLIARSRIPAQAPIAIPTEFNRQLQIGYANRKLHTLSYEGQDHIPAWKLVAGLVKIFEIPVFHTSGREQSE